MDLSRAADATAAPPDEPGLAFAEAVRQLVEHESWPALAAWVQADGDVAGLIGYGGPRAWRRSAAIPLDTRRRRAFSRAVAALRADGTGPRTASADGGEASAGRRKGGAQAHRRAAAGTAAARARTSEAAAASLRTLSDLPLPRGVRIGTVDGAPVLHVPIPTTIDAADLDPEAAESGDAAAPEAVIVSALETVPLPDDIARADVLPSDGDERNALRERLRAIAAEAAGVSDAPRRIRDWTAEARRRLAALQEELSWAEAAADDFLKYLDGALRGNRGGTAKARPVETLVAKLDRAMSAWSRSVRRAAREQRIEAASGLREYLDAFPAARAMERRFVAYLGPTNSGKTHAAMSRLAAAATGRYLAPLRLLALEGYETLQERGVAVSLVTGEERLIDPAATHVASTVEMADFRTRIDCAVIDEVQLLQDEDRGWAWTAAVLGVPAREIVLCGSVDALPLIRRLAELSGSPLEVHRLERKNPLTMIPRPVRLGELEDGDAVIAFSRREVMLLRELILRGGRRVATVYGALTPEVRRAEARRFREGEASVVVATDAIGLGLNMPIRRVLFSAVEKFDGRSERPLTDSEIRQVAGRAGRFGLHEEGFVGGLGVDPRPIAKALARPVRQHDPNARFWVAPTLAHARGTADALGTDSLYQTLDYIRTRLLQNDAAFRVAPLYDALEIAAAIDGTGLSFEDRFVYALAPVDADSYRLPLVVRWARLHAGGQTVPLPAMVRRGSGAGDELQVLEGYAKTLVLYAWLGQRFPDAYADLDRCREARRETDARIETLLATLSRARACRRCEAPLPPRHRHALCDACFAEKRPAQRPMPAREPRSSGWKHHARRAKRR
jgi:ATP-dependent RNA helicase SUPV3L1/SUV3